MKTQVKATGSKKEYYILQWTWGILMNLVGACVCLYAVIRKWPISKYRNAIRIICPKAKGWGGVSLGMFIMTPEGCDSSLSHEYGHSIQNLSQGLLFPFVVAIPSATRLWYREFKYHRKGLTPPTKYDDIWFEGEATQFGKLANENHWNWL